MWVKLLLFADILAGMSRDGPAVAQIILLLLVTIAYWVYIRLFAPPIALSELIVENVAAACDAVTFIFALVVALLPSGNFNSL